MTHRPAVKICRKTAEELDLISPELEKANSQKLDCLEIYQESQMYSDKNSFQ